MDLEQDSSGEWLRGALGLADGETPFGWQQELLQCFVQGDTPRSLDIPTGLGKTAVMAIWLVARGLGAALPRRLVYVVDRRAVVDQATDVAMKLRDYVDDNPEMKSRLGLDGRSLPISTLRGQHVDNRQWLEDPASPAIIVGTVDMIGSRLLFEGYGVSRKMRPYHAGLLGSDALIVLDEAHLVPPFEKLLEGVADGSEMFGPREEALRRVIPGFQLLSLSATGRRGKNKPFGLTDGDLKPGTVTRKRLDAPKRLRTIPLAEGEELKDQLARQAWEVSYKGEHGMRCIVFCDSRKDAEAAEQAVRGEAKKAGLDVETELFVGGRRVFERTLAANRLRELGFIAGGGAPQRAAFVLATSAGEVGVDLDADHMVSDLVAWERMVQRLGRVNRRGDGEAEVVVIGRPPLVPEAVQKPMSERTKKEAAEASEYAERVARIRALESLPKRDGAFDASPGAIRSLKMSAEATPELEAILDAATTPAPLRPGVSRALVDAWSMTTLKKHTGRPEIQPWIRGWREEDGPQTRVVWRRHLPVRRRPPVTEREVEGFFEAAPPHTSEVLETETHRVLRWLTVRAKALSKMSSESGEGTEILERDDVVAVVLTPAGDFKGKFSLGELVLDSDDKRANKRREDNLRGSLTEATLVVDARIGGLVNGLLSDTENTVPRTADDDQSWEPPMRFQVKRIDAESGSSTDANPQWRHRFRFAAEVKTTDEDEPSKWLIVEKWLHDATTEDDRSAGRPQLLDIHEESAERQARELAGRVGLDAEYAEMLAVAARLHDEGKRAKRWQRAFNAPVNGVYAKTAGPINQALLDGYRHEFQSIEVLARDDRLLRLPHDLQDLALHLVAAHHGFARPTIETRGCEGAPPSVLEERSREVALRFARLQKRWGPWGLAWWESLLRAADQQASRENEKAAMPAGEEM